MDQQKSVSGTERRMDLALYDHYVANARAERAKAIAGFFHRIAGWLRPAHARGKASSHTAVPLGRKLTG